MKTNVVSLSFLSIALTATSAAWAAPVSDGESPTAVVAGPVVRAPESAADPNLDRGILQPTAMTQPAGSLTYNNYELLLHGFTYGVTDRLQASVTVFSPIVKDMPFVGFAAVKWRLISAGRLHVAVQGSTAYAHEFSGDVLSSASVYSVGAGAFASYCLRQDCSSLLSGSASYQLAMANGIDDRAQLVVYGGSIVHRVTPHIKLLGEVTSAAGKTPNGELSNVSGALASYGVRFHTGNIASDIGFVKPIFSDGSDPFILGLPFVNVSYRWQ